jgi:hypothetical protein
VTFTVWRVQRKTDCDDHNNLGESSRARKLRNESGKNLKSLSRTMMMSEGAAKFAIVQLQCRPLLKTFSLKAQKERDIFRPEFPRLIVVSGDAGNSPHQSPLNTTALKLMQVPSG